MRLDPETILASPEKRDLIEAFEVELWLRAIAWRFAARRFIKNTMLGNTTCIHGKGLYDRSWCFACAKGVVEDILPVMRGYANETKP